MSKMSKTFVMLAMSLVAILPINSNSTTNAKLPDIQVGSSAELWFQRSIVEKAAYLEGLCEGYQSDLRSNLGAPKCKPSPTLDKANKSRFCSAMWNPSDDSNPGIKYFDTFYGDQAHSDLPAWAAIASYNDKVCGENAITSNLSKFQKHLKCGRDLMNMGFSIAPEARKKQAEYCDTLKWR